MQLSTRVETRLDRRNRRSACRVEVKFQECKLGNTRRSVVSSELQAVHGGMLIVSTLWRKNLGRQTRVVPLGCDRRSDQHRGSQS